ncbi:MAG: YidC/Oxa1 family membrane protein insertase [Actinomycetota bacterium]|nr:YidC/Oxa1 family membrane protein insertase [Actinomycetota bacterium]
MGFFEIFAAVLTGFFALVKSYGFAIILLTVTVRLLLLPLSIKQTRSMREMQVIQPEVKKIQAKHKGDRQKMNEEMMALYKEHGVNPLGGCLPLLMQFPVLIALFYTIKSPLKYMGYGVPEGTPKDAVIPFADYVRSSGAEGLIERLQDSSLAQNLIEQTLNVHQFIFLRLDCASRDALSGSDPLKVGESCGGGLVSALPYLVLVLLMGLTTWYQQKQMQGTRGAQDSPQAQQMQMVGKIMPFMLMVFAYQFPTGVVLYWLTTNVWTIGQQRLMLRAAPPIVSGNGKAAGTPTSKPSSKPASKPGSAKPATGAPGKPGSQAATEATVAPRSKPHPSSKKKKKR